MTAGQAGLWVVTEPGAATPEASVLQWRLDRISALLEEAWRPGEWDPAMQTITYDPDGALAAVRWCAVVGCDITTSASSGLCLGCAIRWRKAGEPDLDGFVSQPRPRPSLSQLHGRACCVSAHGKRCPRPATNRADLCLVHEAQRQRVQAAGRSFEEFLARAVPMPALGICAALVCQEAVHLQGLCARHYSQWSLAGRPKDRAFSDWAARVAPNRDGRTVCLRGLHPLARAEVLYGLQARDREQSKTNPSQVTRFVNQLRAHQVTSIVDLDKATVVAWSRGSRVGPVIWDRVRLAYSDPERERSRDVWDARAFGHEQATTWDFSGIHQDWLRQVTKDWAFVAQTRIRPLTVQARIRSVARFSAQMARRPGGGHDPATVGRADVEAFAVALNRDVLRGKVTTETRRDWLKDVRCVLEEARAVGLLEAVADTFSLTKDLIPPYVASEEEPGQALPDVVVAQLSTPSALDALRQVAAKSPGVMGDHVGQQWVVLFETLRDTGRRPAELTSLGVDAVARDHDGGPILVYDNRKSRRHGRRLPIGEDLHAKLWAWRQVVVARFPDTPTDKLALFPRPTRNRDGTKPILADQLSHKFGDWVSGLERIDGPDRDSAGRPMPFDRNRIHPYAFRHTYAQRHADAGTPVEVLQALMDHTDIKTTQGYFRITSKRKRQATEQVARMRRGANSDPRPLAALSDVGHLRNAIAQVAVPFGLCAEPANVQAGGQHCPIRYRCLGCDSFTSDPSFLPDLRAHLDELLRARERGEAMGANDWALVPMEEITRLRSLIRSLEADLATLPQEDRLLVERACADLRTARRTVPVTIGWRTS